MLTESTCKTVQKRTLKKIRAQFLYKRDETEEETYVNPDTRYLSGDTISALNPNIGLIETNRKISLGPQNLKLFFKVSDFTIEPLPFTRIAKVNFSGHEDIAPLPWDYTLKRLESYGDLELATLAHRLDKFRPVAHRLISELHGSLSKDDPITRKMWDDTKASAKRLCEEVEKNRMFYKVLIYITKDSEQMLSNSYSEGLLEEMGYSPETFLKCVEKNGLPTLFQTDSPVYATAVRNFFEMTIFLGNKLYASPIEETYIYDDKKIKRKMLVQNVAALEPVPNGFLLHSYFVGKDTDSKNLEVKKKKCETLESREP